MHMSIAFLLMKLTIEARQANDEDKTVGGFVPRLSIQRL